jgi:hypothetical protein
LLNTPAANSNPVIARICGGARFVIIALFLFVDPGRLLLTGQYQKPT